MPSANASAATTLYVGGEDLYTTSGTKSNTANTATYNASTTTLTLNNATLTGGVVLLDYDETVDTLKLKLTGTNKITDGNTDNGMNYYGYVHATKANLAIDGTGSLSITSNQAACISTTGGASMNITSATLDLQCRNYPISNGATAAPVTITGATIKSQSANTDGGSYSLTGTATIKNSTITTSSDDIDASTLIIDNSKISSQGVSGGNVSSGGDITITGSTITTSGRFGVTDAHGSISVRDSVITTNNGGSLSAQSGLAITNSKITTTNDTLGLTTYTGNITMSGNSTTFEGNGISAFQSKIILNDGLGISGGYISSPSGEGEGVYGCDGHTLAGHIRVAYGLSNTACEAALASANLGTTIDNPNTADHDWIYGLIAAVLTGAFFLGRRFYLKH